MVKSLGLLTVLIVAMIAISLFSLDNISTCLSGNTIGGGPTGVLEDTNSVGQTFRSPYPGLYRIDAVLDDLPDDLGHDSVALQVQESPTSTETIYERGMQARDESGTSGYFTAEFPPILDSANQDYYFGLSVSQREPPLVVRVPRSSEDTYAAGRAWVNDNPAEGDLVFVTCYALTRYQRLGFLFDRLADDRPSVWGDRRLYSLLTVTYLVLISLLLVQIFNLTSKNRSR